MPLNHRAAASLLFASLFTAPALIPAFAQVVSSPAAKVRITTPIDDARLTVLTGNTHPALRASTDLGLVDAALPMQRVQLVLKRSPERQAALDLFMAQQYKPGDPNFHHWLSATQFGQLFGPSDTDIATVTHWLQNSGFDVTAVSKGRLTIEFSGTAAQVQKAFHTEIHRYQFKGVNHIANRSDPQIPEALTPVVAGVQSLNNFFATPQHTQEGKLTRNASGRLVPADPAASPSLRSLAPVSGGRPQLTSTTSQGTFYYVSPQDFSVIYNENPLFASGIDGTGVSVAIAARSEVSPTDIATFQSEFGLPKNSPAFIHNGPSPGFLTGGDQQENTLDVEWSGAAAPGAKITPVISASTSTSDGFVLSAQYIVDNNVASIMSSSYGNCELNIGASGNQFFNALWQQGAAEGISVFVSAGDQSAAGCDSSNQDTPYAAADGLQVNGLASTPYNTAVGGTDFGQADFNTPSDFWNSTNTAAGESAKGYIPEVPWNSTCTNPIVASFLLPGGTPDQTCNAILYYQADGDYVLLDIVGGSGGKSGCTDPTGTTPATCAGAYAKPSWQTGPGVPADSVRDIPDVSLFAANGLLGSAYVFQYDGGFAYAGGTSFGSPAFAGLMALVVQKQGAAQGLANPVFYQLAAAQSTSACSSDTVAAGNACYFYDTVSGNNSTPCYPGTTDCTTNPSDQYGDQVGILNGYTTTAGFDLASGLGTVNVTNLVNGWSTITGVPATTITISPATLPQAPYTSSYSQQLTASGGVAPYTFTVSSGSLPMGFTLDARSGMITGVGTGDTGTFTVTATDSNAGNQFSGARAYTLNTNGQPNVGEGSVHWVPARSQTYTGLPIGTDVLNAYDTFFPQSSVSYTATLLNDATTEAVTASTVLSAGAYILTVNTYYANGTGGSFSDTATMPFTVLPQHVWLVSGNGTLEILDDGGNLTTSGLTGGGAGIAIDSAGTAWSADTTGASLSTFSDFGYLFNPATTGGGLNGATALAIDGNGQVWIINSNNSISRFTNDSVAVSPADTGYNSDKLNKPSAIAIDSAGVVWVTDKGNNTITKILGAAAPVTPIATSVTLGAPALKP